MYTERERLLLCHPDSAVLVRRYRVRKNGATEMDVRDSAVLPLLRALCLDRVDTHTLAHRRICTLTHRCRECALLLLFRSRRRRHRRYCCCLPAAAASAISHLVLLLLLLRTRRICISERWRHGRAFSERAPESAARGTWQRRTPRSVTRARTHR